MLRIGRARVAWPPWARAPRSLPHAACAARVLSTVAPPEPKPAKPGLFAVVRAVLTREGDAVSAPSVPGSQVSTKQLLGLLKPEVVPLAFSVGTLGVTTAISLVFPAAVGHILDMALAPTPAFTPVTIAVGMFGLFAVQTVFMGVRTTLLANMGERIANRIRKYGAPGAAPCPKFSFYCSLSDPCAPQGHVLQAAGPGGGIL